MVSSSLADFVNKRAESVFPIFFFILFFFFGQPFATHSESDTVSYRKKLLYYNLILKKSKYFFLDQFNKEKSAAQTVLCKSEIWKP